MGIDRKHQYSKHTDHHRRMFVTNKKRSLQGDIDTRLYQSTIRLFSSLHDPFPYCRTYTVSPSSPHSQSTTATSTTKQTKRKDRFKRTKKAPPPQKKRVSSDNATTPYTSEVSYHQLKMMEKLETYLQLSK